MATYIISDIHGEFLKFKNALTKVKFSKSDTLFILGDMIDRGMDSKAVLDLIIRLRNAGFNVNCLLGNHEKMFVDSRSDFAIYMKWLKVGGSQTLSSFLTANIENVPDIYFNFINSLPYYIEYNDYIFVHAGLDMSNQNPFEDRHSMLWLRDWSTVYDENWLNERTVIHGHTPMNRDNIEQQVRDGKKVIGIDNGAFLSNKGNGGLCILHLESMTFQFQY
jgi:serine/threonine protein phosphatase 1